LLRQVLPNVRQLGVLYSDGSYPNLAPLLAEFEIAGTQLGMQVVPVQAPRPEDFDSSLEAFARAGGDVVYPSQDPVTSRNEAEIAAVAIRHGLATLCVRSDWVQQGCLMSYGANRSAYYVHVATHIDRVLRGAQPGDLPIELPTVYDLSVNVKTLQALGVTVPQSALPLVTEWIE